MKSILLLIFTAATLQAAVIYDGIRTGYSGIRDFHDADDSAGIYLSLGATGYTIESADAMRVWNAAPFATWPTGDPIIQVFGTTLGSNLGNGVQSPNYANLIGTLSFTSITEPRGTTVSTEEIVHLQTAAPITLSANQNYWVIVTMAPGGSGMSLTNTPTANGPTVQNIIGSSTNGNIASASSGNLSIRLNGIAIPEPTTAALVLLTSLTLLKRRR